MIVAAAVLVVIGFAGIVVPGLPGTVLVFAGLLLAAWSDGFVHVGVATIVILAALTALSYVIDFVTVAAGMRRMGASRLAMAGAAIGTLVGLAFGLVGLILGPFLGAVLGELAARRDVRGAGRAGAAAWLGFVFGAVAKIALAAAMVGVFVTAWLWT